MALDKLNRFAAVGALPDDLEFFVRLQAKCHTSASEWFIIGNKNAVFHLWDLIMQVD
jgi:hypothetical protein